jgi:hypothetical protein
MICMGITSDGKERPRRGSCGLTLSLLKREERGNSTATEEGALQASANAFPNMILKVKKTIMKDSAFERCIGRNENTANLRT